MIQFLHGTKMKFCHRGKIFSCHVTPSHQALRHQELRVSLIHDYGVRMMNKIGLQSPALQGYVTSTRQRFAAFCKLPVDAAWQLDYWGQRPENELRSRIWEAAKSR